jgi:hypothetical protein
MQKSSLIIESNIVDGIPVLTVVPQSFKAYPVVFFIPGYGSSKEQGLRLGARLAREGFFFAAFDPWLHGERYDPRLDHAADPELGGIYPPETGLDTFLTMYRVIERCSEDVHTLRDHLRSDPRADIANCGVTGLSMGGYASFLVFAHQPAVRAAVPMIGIPTFHRRWIDLLDECAFSVPEWAEALEKVDAQTREITAWIKTLDPFAGLTKAPPRALLIMNCDFDHDQPKLYSIHAARELIPHYRDHPEKLRLRIYPAGHQITPAMETDAVNWFIKMLQEG